MGEKEVDGSDDLGLDPVMPTTSSSRPPFPPGRISRWGERPAPTNGAIMTTPSSMMMARAGSQRSSDGGTETEGKGPVSGGQAQNHPPQHHTEKGEKTSKALLAATILRPRDVGVGQDRSPYSPDHGMRARHLAH